MLIDPFHDYSLFLGGKGSGKTTLMQMFASKVSKSNIYLLNTSREKSWEKYVNKENIYYPNLLTLKEFNKLILQMVSDAKSKSLLIFDDVDAFPNLRKSDVFYSIISQSRHMDIGVMVSSRLLNAFPIGFYTQADRAFFASQKSRYVVQYIATYVGLENAYSLIGMPQYTFGVWDNLTREMQKMKLSK
jgi:hypothetical protein